MKPKSVKILSITGTVETQSRCTLNSEVVDNYAERMAEGDKFPPIVLFEDKALGDGTPLFYMADGFHRVAACVKNGYVDVLADVRPGTQLDALKYSIGANRTNGLARSNADKRNCVRLALENFGTMSDRALAELVGVSDHFVGNLRLAFAEEKKLTCEPFAPVTASLTRTGLDGKQYPAHSAKPAPAPVAAPVGEFTTDEKLQIVQAAPPDSPWMATFKTHWNKGSRVEKCAAGAWAKL